MIPNWRLGLRKFWIVISLALSGVTIPFSGRIAQAQITPDGTLGNEASVVTKINELVEQIDGGALRGSNLFHSFLEFNIGEGRAAYFSNPAAVQNIFSRVTGSNPSRLLGKLGVLGDANLFFLNPNGIIFGPNASLDLRGSFVASTASSLKFPDGTEFSATNPEAPPLLTVNVKPPVGLRLEGSGEFITSEGNLAAGQDLTLSAGNLDLQGQLQAGRDLRLQALDTVKVRDSALAPFIAAAGGQLQVQGNQGVDIFALNHPDSGFFSGGDMVLRSANPVGGDAHYWSGGSFRIEQLDGSLGNWFSPFDPIIRASGDVSFDSYTGASLHILAGGSVTITGNVTITGTDAPENSLQENVELSDETTVVAINGSAEPTLDIRAGTTEFEPPGITGDTAGFSPAPPDTGGTGTSADITIGRITNSGGRVFLTNQYQPNTALPGGAIQVGSIDTSSALGGGSVIIDSRSDITVTNAINSSSSTANAVFATSGDGGAITLRANGSISTGALNSSSSATANASFLFPFFAATSGDGGAINLWANGSISTGALDSSSSANAFSADNPLSAATSGTGGAITLRANGSISTGALNSSSSATAFFPFFPFVATSGDGGAINLWANGSISTGALNSSSSASYANAFLPGTSSDGGAITLRANGDIILKPGATIESVGLSGGNITLDSGGAIAINGTVDASADDLSDIFFFGDGGDITLLADGNITLNPGSVIESLGLLGGNITLKSGGTLSIDDSRIANVTTGNGTGGEIRLTAQSKISLENFARVYTITGLGNGQGGNLIVNASGNASEVEVLNKGGERTPRGGNPFLERVDQEVFPGTVLGTLTFGEGGAGDLTIQANRLTIKNESKPSENLSAGAGTIVSPAILPAASSGKGGNLTVIARDSVKIVGNEPGPFIPDPNNRILVISDLRSILTGMTAVTLGSGDAGNLTIHTRQLTMQNGVSVNTGTIASENDAGKGGRLTVNARESVELQGKALLITGTLGPGDAGQLTVNAGRVTLQDGGTIAADTAALGNAGNLTINTAQLNIFKGSRVGAATLAEGKGGKVTVNATDSVEVSGTGTSADGTVTVPSGIFTNSLLEFEGGDGGNAGDLEITTSSLSLANGAQLNSSTEGKGDGGNINIRARQGVEMRGTGLKNFDDAIRRALETGGNVESLQKFLQEEASSSTATVSTGGAGTITIDTPSLVLRDGAILTSTTFGPGKAGGIVIHNAESVELIGSGLVAGTFNPNAEASGGKIDIDTGKLSLQDGGRILTTTFGKGKGGNVDVRASESVELGSTPAGVILPTTINASSVFSTGQAGKVTIETPKLIVRDGAQIVTTSGSDSLEPVIPEGGPGGDIVVRASESVEVSGTSVDGRFKSALTAETFSAAPAGDLLIETGNLIIRDGAEVSARATGEKGTAGSVTINTSQLTVSDGARVTVSSPEGQAGNLSITAHSLSLNGGRLTAETGKSGAEEEGANITLQISDLLTLSNESLISAEAFDKANGGNIEILNANGFIIAFPPEGPNGSDIIANAFFGNGGRIEITTQGLFGIEERKASEGNQTNDIDASSEFGLAGSVEINTSGIDPTRGLTNLPEETVESEVAEGCQAEAGEPDLAFYHIGRGGLPPILDEPLSIETLIVPLIPFDVEAEDKTVQTWEEIFSISEMKEKFFLTPACRVK